MVWQFLDKPLRWRIHDVWGLRTKPCQWRTVDDFVKDSILYQIEALGCKLLYNLHPVATLDTKIVGVYTPYSTIHHYVALLADGTVYEYDFYTGSRRRGLSAVFYRIDTFINYYLPDNRRLKIPEGRDWD